MYGNTFHKHSQHTKKDLRCTICYEVKGFLFLQKFLHAKINGCDYGTRQQKTGLPPDHGASSSLTWTNSQVQDFKPSSSLQTKKRWPHHAHTTRWHFKLRVDLTVTPLSVPKTCLVLGPVQALTCDAAVTVPSVFCFTTKT